MGVASVDDVSINDVISSSRAEMFEKAATSQNSGIQIRKLKKVRRNLKCCKSVVLASAKLVSPFSLLVATFINIFSVVGLKSTCMYTHLLVLVLYLNHLFSCRSLSEMVSKQPLLMEYL